MIRFRSGRLEMFVRLGCRRGTLVPLDAVTVALLPPSEACSGWCLRRSIPKRMAH